MHALLIASIVLSWLIALVWTASVLNASRNITRLPDLLDHRWDPPPVSLPNEGARPQITVIVPALNEAAAIEATLGSLLAQTIPLEIVAVDDRSTDATGTIMDRVASGTLPEDKYLSVIHIESLPAGWLGKNHAMALAARQTATPWLLFTDGDTLLREDTLARALHFAQENGVDHVVLWPSLILKTPGERMVEGIFQTLLIPSWRPWKVADPKAKRESIGMGAFNLIRSEVYRAVGGFEAEPMEVVEDIRLGSAVKRAGYRQRLVLGHDMLRLHWAPGAFGLLHNLTKNIFAMFGFQTLQLLLATLAMGLLCFIPLADLLAHWPLRAAGIISLVMVFLAYRLSGRWYNRISPVYFFTFPIGGVLVVYAMLRSWLVTVFRGGVVWRGTFYPLRELRRQAGPLR